MKNKYLILALLISFVITLSVVSNAQAGAIDTFNEKGGGVKRDNDCCEGDCCNLSTNEGCIKYENGKCPTKCSAIGKLPNFIKTYPGGMTANTYIRSKGDAVYQVCFSGPGLIYRNIYGDWVYLGGIYTGVSGQTCVYGLSGDGVYAFVQ